MKQGRERLIVVPTAMEMEALNQAGGIPESLGRVRLCGLGPVAAAARTAAELAESPEISETILVGIAGSFRPKELPPGEAREFSLVAIDGIGIGEGKEARGLGDLGFPQWPGEEFGRDSPSVGDRLSLGDPDSPPPPEGLVLTVCAASSSPEHAALRLARHPTALAEEMEGFGVAMASVLARVPVRIVRGISNRVGDRDRAGWEIPGALRAARQLLLETLCP